MKGAMGGSMGGQGSNLGDYVASVGFGRDGVHLAEAVAQLSRGPGRQPAHYPHASAHLWPPREKPSPHSEGRIGPRRLMNTRAPAPLECQASQRSTANEYGRAAARCRGAAAP